jgi:hypothetical protein
MGEFDSLPVILYATIGRGGSCMSMSCEGQRIASSDSHWYLKDADEMIAHAAEQGLVWARDAVIIDSTFVSEDNIVSYACKGPMCDPMLPDRTRHPVFGPVEPYHFDSAEPFCGGLSRVSLDNYVAFALHFGAHVSIMNSDGL